MNKRDQKAISKLYKSAPRLESPDSLDQRILQSAANHMPKKKSAFGSNWMPLLASACLASIAVYIALPIFEYEDRARQGLEVKQEIHLEEQVAADSVSTVAPASLPVEQKLKKSRLAVKEESGDSDSVPALRIDDELKSISSAAESTARTKPSALPAETEPSLQSQPESFRAQAAQTYLSIEEIDRTLEEIRTLAKRQLLDQAQQLLDELIQRCPDCGLPTTVAELE